MKREEAFALHMKGLFADAINNHTGILHGVIARLDGGVWDEVHGSVRDLLERQANLLQKKLQRAVNDMVEFVGGADNMRALSAQDFQADCMPSCDGWKPKKEENPSGPRRQPG